MGDKLSGLVPDTLTTERLLPHLAEPLDRSGDALPGHGVRAGTSRGRGQAVDGTGPRLVVAGRAGIVAVMWSLSVLGDGQAAAARAAVSSSWMAIASSSRVRARIWR